MYDTLENLLRHDVEEVLNTPSLLMDLLRIYSHLFLNDKPCQTCSKSHRLYFSRLQREGFTKLQKMTKLAEKYKIKPNTILNYKGELFSEFNLTDKKAEEILKEFPSFSAMFLQIPEKEEKKEVKEELKKELSETIEKPKVKRTTKKAK